MRRKRERGVFVFLPYDILPLIFTCLTASPSFHTWGDFPSIWLQAEYSTTSKSATLLNFGWSFWFGSQKCSISAIVNSLWKTFNNIKHLLVFTQRSPFGLLYKHRWINIFIIKVLWKRRANFEIIKFSNIINLN